MPSRYWTDRSKFFLTGSSGNKQDKKENMKKTSTSNANARMQIIRDFICREKEIPMFKLF
jgi:hypothetical protein